MMEEQQRDVREVHNHFAEGSNCQVFNGNISGCVFAMPGSTVTQQAAVPVSKQAAPVAEESGIGREDSDEELFRFIHPAVEDEEAWRIHHAIKRLVANYRIPDICAYLKEQKQKGKLMLPSIPSTMYSELVRLGMPNGEGFSEKNFSNSYTK